MTSRSNDDAEQVDCAYCRGPMHEGFCEVEDLQYRIDDLNMTVTIKDQVIEALQKQSERDELRRALLRDTLNTQPLGAWRFRELLDPEWEPES